MVLAIFLNIIYLQLFDKFINTILVYNLFLINIIVSVFPLFLLLCKLTNSFFISKIKKYYDSLSLKSKSFNYISDMNDFLNSINHIYTYKFFYLYRLNYRYSLIKSTCYFSKMYIITSNYYNLINNYVS